MFGGLSATEILFVLVIALIIFGPRKLPELGKSLGHSLAQFRKASEDFKRSWEGEILIEEKRSTSASTAPSHIPYESSVSLEQHAEENEPHES